MNQLTTKLFLPFFLLFLVAGCSIQKNPVTGNKRAFGYSWSQEVQIGKEVDPEIVGQFGLYDDEQLAAYTDEIGQLMLEKSHLRRSDTDQKFRETEFTFRMLDSPVINAFALPGGYIYFTRGMMAHLSNEAQFSVVMGHEIGHVAARHSSQRALNQKIGQVAVVGGAVLGQEIFGLPGQTLMDLSSTAAQLLFLSYGRDAERESDELGVEYAAMNGYDAAEGSALFTTLERISENSGQSVPNFLSTHPDPGQRAQTIPKIADIWEERGYKQTKRNTDRYMEMVDGLVFGDNPRQGFNRDGTFYHPDLEFKYVIPDGWQLINQPSQVVLLSPEEDAVSIFRIDSETDSPRQSVKSVTSGEEIKVSEEGETKHKNGWTAYAAKAEATLEDGTPLTLYLYAVEYNNTVYRYLNYTDAGKYDAFEPDFQRVTASFDRLTDSGILNIEPVRLQTFKAQKRAPFKAFLPESLPMDIQPLDVAIINQVELDEQIDQGRWLKIPVQ